MPQNYKLITIGATLVVAAALVFIMTISGDKTPENDKNPNAAKVATKTKSIASQDARQTPSVAPMLPAQGQSKEAVVSSEAVIPAPKELVMNKLHEASVSYDPSQLPLIEPHLRDPDPEIRAAALDAVVVLGDAAGAALLREAAKVAASAEEAENLEKTADYLELPPADLSKRRKKKNTQETPQASEQ
jgi:hypothetical protein